MPPDGSTAPWVPREVPRGRQLLESQNTGSQPQGRRGARRCQGRRSGESGCKPATNACQVQGSGLHAGFVFIASTLETELNSSQQKNKDSSELYRNSRQEIYEYDFPVKSSIFLFTPCNPYVAESCATRRLCAPAMPGGAPGTLPRVQCAPSDPHAAGRPATPRGTCWNVAGFGRCREGVRRGGWGCLRGCARKSERVRRRGS